MISKRWMDAGLSLLIVLIFMGIAEWKSRTPGSFPWLRGDFRSHVGAEYHCIATAVLKGRGFSDPFHKETGPTAWMPPVLPYAMAGFRWLFPSPTSLVNAMIVLQGISVWSAVWIVLAESRRLKVPLALAVAVILMFLSTNFYQLFQMTHDTGLLLLVVSLLWISFGTWNQDSSNRFSILWGLWGGFVTLCSPIIGVAWIVMTIFGPVGFRFQKIFLSKRIWIAFLFWLIAVSPWMIRNRVVMGEWFFVKPNGMYEVWQSQCNDDDGVVDSQSMSGHPWSSPNGEQMASYLAVGEIVFIQEKSKLAKSSICSNPLQFLMRVVNRAEATLWYYHSFSVMDEYFAGGWPVTWTRIVHPLPFLAITLVVVFAKVPLEPTAFRTMLLFILLLGPYILISYYDRYAAMTVGLKMLLLIYALFVIRQFKVPRKRSQTSEE